MGLLLLIAGVVLLLHGTTIFGIVCIVVALVG